MGSGERRRRLVWLIWARVVISTLLLGSATVFQINQPGSLPIDPFFFLIGLTYCLSVVYATTIAYVERWPWLADLQFFFDACTVSAFIYFTGGVTSYFPLLYVVPVIGAASIQRKPGALRVAAVSAMMYAALVLTAYMGSPGYVAGHWMRDLRPLLPPVRIAAFTVATDSIALAAVALLAGSLAERLRSADARLEDASLALADLQAFNEHVIDSLTSGLATTDPAGRVITFNRAAEAIIGRSAAEVVGRHAGAVLQLPQDFVRLLDSDLGGQRAARADYVFRAESGQAIDLGLSAAHLVTPDGRGGYLLTFQDVTEMRRLEREGRQRHRLAAVGEMAAGIAHEIRNPLASMRGSIQILRAELRLTEEQADLMDIVLRESDRLNEIIRSFLSYARPQPLAAGPVNLGRLLRDTAVLIRNSPETLPAHRIDVEAPDNGPIIDGDDAQVRQVVWNLATNGLRAMPEGGRLVLRAHGATVGGRGEGGDGAEGCERGDGMVSLEVEDEGIGIPAEQLDTLFQPFRGSFARGSGLGLAIVHRIVSDHHGEIGIESEVGKGTRVTVRLKSRAEAGSGHTAARRGERAAGSRGEPAAGGGQLAAGSAA